MALTPVTDAANSNVAAIKEINDDPIEDDAIAQPDVITTYFIQHLIFIFGSFKLVAALSSTISVSGKNLVQTDQAFEQRKKKIINDQFLTSNPIDVLNISLGCVPVSVDADAQKVRWPHWATLLPEIPGNAHFQIQGASA